MDFMAIYHTVIRMRWIRLIAFDVGMVRNNVRTLFVGIEETLYKEWFIVHNNFLYICHNNIELKGN